MSFNINASKDINYKNSYVAFIDILGFKNLVNSRADEDKDKLESYLGVVNKAITNLKGSSKDSIGSIIISDSIILSVLQSKEIEENIDRLRHLCVAVGFIQLQLSLKNIWARGAISSGKAYFDSSENQIIGPAYIKAYLLEEELVRYPRVILDSKIINELEFTNSTKFIDKINKEPDRLNLENWGKSILFSWRYVSSNPIEKDIPLFIDYLSPIVEENGKDFEKIVENISKSIYSNTNNYSKFKWVVEYLKDVAHTVDTRLEPNINLLGTDPEVRLRKL